MSMREDFEAAIEDADIEPEELEETQQEVEVPSDEHSLSEPEPQESDGEEIVSEKPEISDIPPENEAKAQDTSNDSVKAPIDWSPKQRESWSKIPRQIQDKIVAREQEMNSNMQGTAEARQTQKTFNELSQAYAPILAAEGNATPMQAVQGMFQTMASLRMGSQNDKAQQIAGMIQRYGVDIQALDSLLVGQAPQENPNQQMEQMLDKRMAPVNQLMEQLGTMQQQKQQATQQEAVGAVQQFGAKAEFINDVRMDMADLIDMAAKQGRTLTLEQAYDRACSLNPEIADIIDGRKNQERILGTNNSMSGKRNAASTLNGRMAGSGGGGGVLSMRDTIASAWDDAG
jgi:hypothetical protein